MMPGLNGYETTRSMREIPELQYAKIILVSAKAMLTDRLKGYEAGADDYITKPFDHEELAAKVRVFLRLKTAEEVERLQSEFLTILGHQFRTPLTHVLGAAEMLATDNLMEPATQRLLCDSVLSGARRMNWLLDYLNHFHVVRAGRIAAGTHPVPLPEAVREALLDLTPATELKRVRLTFDDTAASDVIVDRMHLAFVLRTLLSEAVTASPEGGVIRVGLASEGGMAQVRVSDRRSVIDPDHLDRLFDLFWVQSVRHHGGDISSLPLAREIARQSGGDLRLEGSTAEGTTFVLCVPLSVAGQVAGQSEGAADVDLAA
jgi:signal transduction histidine kinase